MMQRVYVLMINGEVVSVHESYEGAKKLAEARLGDTLTEYEHNIPGRWFNFVGSDGKLVLSAHVQGGWLLK